MIKNLGLIRIKVGDIFMKDYVDHKRYFIAVEDSVGMYCHCLDMVNGGLELVKIPMVKSSTKITILSE